MATYSCSGSDSQIQTKLCKPLNLTSQSMQPQSLGERSTEEKQQETVPLARQEAVLQGRPQEDAGIHSGDMQHHLGGPRMNQPASFQECSPKLTKWVVVPPVMRIFKGTRPPPRSTENPGLPLRIRWPSTAGVSGRKYPNPTGGNHEKRAKSSSDEVQHLITSKLPSQTDSTSRCAP